MTASFAARAAVLAALLAAGGAATAADGAALAARLRDLIGTPVCSVDTECRTLPYGAKACGGPQAWVAWSTRVSDEAALRAAGEKFAAWRREDVRASGMVSDCALVVDPGAVCAPAPAASADGVRTCVLRSTKTGRGRLAQ